MASTYANERTDPAWASRQTQALAAAARSPQMTQIGADIHDLQIDCRATVCRIGGSFASRTAADDWLMLYLPVAGANMPQSTYNLGRDASGRITLEMYGGR